MPKQTAYPVVSTLLAIILVTAAPPSGVNAQTDTMAGLENHAGRPDLYVHQCFVPTPPLSSTPKKAFQIDERMPFFQVLCMIHTLVQKEINDLVFEG